ncbi:hypothetical protein DICSQDRAFT_167296 [Dichomitus squalens LYAD-421 SS1]|uniref:uncharacterized protein n=1 Tax=Dichomitus squalens (strain LYAD-421) TaxID=732165 RepID=UPI0004415191|nr:uncharacterized protein DICSQDRAFT_167296 [Dichomitus squalens LYAD-421 SS1]EJF64126.1 hypothetical protein DICSQDRAFT_167296 [Dichomitus squalens LYAD-421 SS1]
MYVPSSPLSLHSPCLTVPCSHATAALAPKPSTSLLGHATPLLHASVFKTAQYSPLPPANAAIETVKRAEDSSS